MNDANSKHVVIGGSKVISHRQRHQFNYDNLGCGVQTSNCSAIPILLSIDYESLSLQDPSHIERSLPLQSKDCERSEQSILNINHYQ